MTLILMVAIALLVALILLIFIYPDRSVGTHARPDLPGPKGLPLVGNMFQLLPYRKTMLKHLAVMEREYGELFTFTMPGWGRNIVINRPEWLEHMRKSDAVGGYGKGDIVLAIFNEFPGPNTAVGSEDALWRRSRKIIQPVFTTSKFDEKVSCAMANVVPVAQQLLRSVAEEEVELDFNHFSGRVVIDVLCKMVMDLDLDLLSADPSCLHEPHRLVDAVTTMSHMSSGRLYNPFWKVSELLNGERARFNQARRDLHETIDKIVQERQRSLSEGSADRDFLSTLLTDSNCEEPVLLRDALILLIFAGRDNNQNALSWSLHELSQHPEWLDKMRDEVKKNGSTQTVKYSDISNYPIHLAVFYETLRLWPGVPKNARIALKDDVLPAVPELGYDPVHVSKGDYILWSDMSMMRNKTVWGENADIFDPGRHMNTDGRFVKPAIPKFHSFGHGPRYCPGAQLAAYEFVSVWAGITPYFDLLPIDMNPNSRSPTDALTMQMEGSFMVRVKERIP